METQTHPTFGNGKICYIVMPALDIAQSAAFYETVFGWHTRTRGDGSISFDDGVGEVSGTWITGRKADKDPAMMIHLMVDDMDITIDKITMNGGVIVQPADKRTPDITATFTDPAGNLLGLYQHGKK